MSRPDFFEIIAKERGVPDGWRWYSSKVIGDGEHSAFVVTGAVPNGTISRGKHKGRPKYDESTKRDVVITRAEMSAARDKWEAATGLCKRCEGEGKLFSSSAKQDDGTWVHTYRDCKRCGNTGRFPSVTAIGTPT